MNATTAGPDLELLLAPTRLLDFHHQSLTQLLSARGWMALQPYERIAAAYNFVRDEIAFGYNRSDNLPASAVLADGMGQCNTKATLLMALLRSLQVPCRFHGFTITKQLQRGVITGLAYWMAPRSIIHSWVEIWFRGRWINLEGFILDRSYLGALQDRYADHRGPFCGYAAATPDLMNPDVDWCGSDTYIQRDGINRDLGRYPDPDAFYATHGVNLAGFRRWLFVHYIRHRLNRRVLRLRERR